MDKAITTVGRRARRRVRTIWCVVATVAAGATIAGCAGRSQPPARVGYVRLDALLKLHPAYTDMRALNGGQSPTATATVRGVAQAPPVAGKVSAMAPSGSLREPSAAAMAQRGRAAVEHFLAVRSEAIDRRIARQLALRAREWTRDIAAEDAGARAGLQQDFARERDAIVRKLQPAIFNLQLQIANLERLAESKLGAAELQRTQERLAATRKQLQAALREQSEKTAVAQEQLAKRLTALRQAAEERTARQVQALRQTLQRQRDDELAAERDRLTRSVAAPSPPPSGARPAAAAEETAARRLARPSRALAAAQRGWTRDLADAAGDLERRRSELVDFMRRDTRRTADALAREHNWRIEWKPGASASARDITDRVAQWLRAHWGA